MTEWKIVPQEYVTNNGNGSFTFAPNDTDKDRKYTIYFIDECDYSSTTSFTVKACQETANDYFTTEALTSGRMVMHVNVCALHYSSFDDPDKNGLQISYRKKGTTQWTTREFVETLEECEYDVSLNVSEGDAYEWKGTNYSFEQFDFYLEEFQDYPSVNFSSSTCNYRVYGNLLSLFYGDDYKNKTSFPTKGGSATSGNLYGLFRDSSTLTSARGLLLPVTNMTDRALMTAFSGCTNLKTISYDLLSATALSESCYDSMFLGCESLRVAPLLPAKTLVNKCYEKMFSGCTELFYVNASFLNSIPIQGSGSSIRTPYTFFWLADVRNDGLLVADRDAEWVNEPNRSQWQQRNDTCGKPDGWFFDYYTDEGTYFTTTLVDSDTSSGNFVLNVNVGTNYITSIAYSTDGGSHWTNQNNTSTGMTVSVQNVPIGTDVLWSGVGTTFCTGVTTVDKISRLHTSNGNQKFIARGNIMSLLQGNRDYRFANIEAKMAFRDFFYQSAKKDALFFVTK